MDAALALGNGIIYQVFLLFISLRPLSTKAKTKIRKCAEFCSLTKSCAGMIFLPSYCLFQSFITSIFKFSVGAATRKAAVIATKHRRIRSSLTGKFHHTLLLTVERKAFSFLKTRRCDWVCTILSFGH